MLFDIAHHSQPQQPVQIRQEFRRYLKAGVIASTKQTFGDGAQLTALATSRATRGGVARGSPGSTTQDSVSCSPVSLSTNTRLLIAGEIVGWSNTSVG
ncbi:hypothetical protein, partial [Nitrosomonas sp.]|uniref:hypothetical protein n=1 Tax=Nitrosomonas sp. TaxID=42353 RepID=UPI001DCA4065